MTTLGYLEHVSEDAETHPSRLIRCKRCYANLFVGDSYLKYQSDGKKLYIRFKDLINEEESELVNEIEYHCNNCQVLVGFQIKEKPKNNELGDFLGGLFNIENDINLNLQKYQNSLNEDHELIDGLNQISFKDKVSEHRILLRNCSTSFLNY